MAYAVPKIMPVGDSNTEGLSSTGNREFTYRKEMQIILGAGTYDIVGPRQRPSSDPTYDVDHDGIGGQNSTQIEARLLTDLTNYMSSYVAGDLVIIQAGTNDGKLDTVGERETARDNVEDMIDIAEAFNPSLDVYILAIWPTPIANGSFGEMINSDVILYNDILKTMVVSRQVTKSNLYFVDIYKSIMEDTRGFCPTSEDCLYGDFYHPKYEGYQAAGQAIGYSILDCSSAVECTGPNNNSGIMEKLFNVKLFNVKLGGS